MTKLERFRVKNFRSIEESDWIDVDSNSCLVGTNEAGKTNLLLALWKLNPANSEPIVPLNDFPRHIYSNYKAGNFAETIFVEAEFVLDPKLQSVVATALKCDLEQVRKVTIDRMYNGKYHIVFKHSKIDTFPSARIGVLLTTFLTGLQSSEIFQKEEPTLQKAISDKFSKILSSLTATGIDLSTLRALISDIEKFTQDAFGKKKNLPEYFATHLFPNFSFFIDALTGKPVESTQEMRQKVLAEIPKFVYYSDYGNLDSEIFLPRVIEDFERKDLSESARAKVRTLDVLFKYVKLSPKEIYELGNDRKVVVKTVNQHNQLINTVEEDLSEEEIRTWADKKKERAILLRSAAGQLTKSFKQWWLQGDYIFEFEADGHHFRINVSDKLRPEQIELEGRSRGLQWFFSFFLVFLVETKEGHNNSILLLDEPGLSLHPIAQYDLAKFFKKLSEDNQLIYTSHSPFLVDMDNLANVKAVYVDSQTGRTKISANLRYNAKDAEKSIYPIHAALGLTVSDTLLLGCLPVLVEGPSDQVYLSLIKRALIGRGRLSFSKEIVFIPTGGVKGVGPVSKLVMARDNELPTVLLDSDKPGKEYKAKLLSDRYKDSASKVIEVSQFLGEQEYEIEDLIPGEAIVETIDKMFRSEHYLEESIDYNLPLVPQIELWAKDQAIALQEGWKVDVSRQIQNKFDKYFTTLEDSQIEIWLKLFSSLLGKE